MDVCDEVSPIVLIRDVLSLMRSKHQSGIPMDVCVRLRCV